MALTNDPSTYAEAMEFFDKKVHDENLNVEFHSVKNCYYCILFPDPDIDDSGNGLYRGFSQENIYKAFYDAYQQYRAALSC